MLFVYPAIISDKVSPTYLPGIIKTIELYFLDKIIADISSQSVNLYVTQNRITGRYSQVRMEHNLLCENLGYDEEEVNKILTEVTQVEVIEGELNKLRGELAQAQNDLNQAEADLAQCLDEAKPKETAMSQTGRSSEQHDEYYEEKDAAGNIISRGYRRSPFRVKQDPTMQSGTASRSDVTVCRVYRDQIASAKSRIDSLESQIRGMEKRHEIAARSAGEVEKAKLRHDYEMKKIKDEEERAKKYSAVGGAEQLKVDTQLMLDLRPTSTVVRVPLEIRKKKILTVIPEVDQASRDIPISVKVIPIIAKNFDDVYTALTKDYFSNKFSQLFKAASRKLISGGLKFLGPVAKKLLRQTKDPKNVDVFRDIILSKSGIINSGQFKRGGGGRGKSDRFSSSIVIFGADDVRDEDKILFKDPDKLQTLYHLGWKVFAIADDKDQQLDFCSALEGGAMCTKIPYSHVYKSLQAHDLFKDADQLSRFTSRVIGNFRRTNYKKLTAEATMVNMLTEQRVQMLYERFGGK